MNSSPPLTDPFRPSRLTAVPLAVFRFLMRFAGSLVLSLYWPKFHATTQLTITL